MCDVKELTAKLKAAAIAVKETRGIARYTKATTARQNFEKLATEDNVLALTEALEAAEKHVAYMEEMHDDLVRQARSFREAHDSASEIIRQLEARVLTVKMPTTKYQWGGGVLNTIDPVDMLYELRKACATAGIALQIEGE